MSAERILFITGRLSEFSLRRQLQQISPQIGFEYEVEVLGISVAALMHCDWVSRKLTDIKGCDRAVLPGWCQGSLEPLADQFGVPFERGPKDLAELPSYFGQMQVQNVALNDFDIEIFAEINHAPRLSIPKLLNAAETFRTNGADVIDLGCIPGEPWSNVADAVAELKQAGFRLSIDSFERTEVEAAVAAGAEFVLSCNQGNLDWAKHLPAELIVIPDDINDISTLEVTIDELAKYGAKFRIDPILQPIGFGFADSLERYCQVRRRWPELPMMMGIGNLTELSDVDSAGINLILAGFCQELEIHSVLTTEVINWCRTSVRELEVARRLVAASVREGVLPKHLTTELLLLRDAQLPNMGNETLRLLASQIKDSNFRIFVENEQIHIMNRDGHWIGTDAYQLIAQVQQQTAELDSAHAFYLGYELSKAVTAMTLGKRYVQDQSLRWGFLTREETSLLPPRHNHDQETAQHDD